MASVNSSIRRLVKPLLFRLLGKRGYIYAQVYGKIRDIKHRLVEEKEMVLLPEFIYKGSQTIDIGANYAYYSERMAQLAGPTGKVWAFEPIPFTHEVCKIVLRKLKIDNVYLHRLGVSERNEKVTFNIPVMDFGAISAGQSHIAGRNNNSKEMEDYYVFKNHQQIECEVVKLDDFLMPQLNELSFVKIDIEGAEIFALKGMIKIIEKFKPVFLIEVQPLFLKGFEIDANDFYNFIRNEMQYSIYYYDQQKEKLIPANSFHDNNFILIHNEKVTDFTRLILHEK